MLYTDEFLQSLQHDPIARTREICRIALAKVRPGRGWVESEYEAFSEAYVLIDEMKAAGLLPFEIDIPTLSLNKDFETICPMIRELLDDIVARCDALVEMERVEQIRSRVRGNLGVAFAYEFTQGDLERVQVLINQVRDLIAGSGKLEAGHQRRLLKRLEALQSELHKRIADLDRFWGLIGDAGVVMAKLGNDAKPIVDRIREIADIIWQTQGRAEELPSGISLPQIGHDPRSDRLDA